MTEKQKQAIRVLNKLLWNDSIKEDDYFLLLEFIVGQHVESTKTHPWETDPALYPWTRRLTEDPQPIDPVYGKFGKVTCNQNNTETTLTEKEEQQ